MFARTALVGALALLCAAPTAQAAHTLKLDLASPQNAAPDGVAAQTPPLRSGVRYIVRVSGTGSLWANDPAAPVTCGTAARRPISELSPGTDPRPATVDGAVVFAAPKGVPFLGGFACVPPTPTRPPAAAALRMGTGGKLAAVVPLGGAPTVPAADHTYYYEVRGRGRPLQLQYADPVVDDNSGVLTVTVRSRLVCMLTGCLPPKLRRHSGPRARGAALRLVDGGGLPCVFTALPGRDGAPAATELCGR